MAKAKSVKTDKPNVSLFGLKLTFKNPMLATNPANQNLYDSYVKSKLFDSKKRMEQLTAEEIAEAESERVAGIEEQGFSVFLKHENPADLENDGKFFIYDYLVLGTLKEAANVNAGANGIPDQFRAKMNNCVAISPRKIFLPFTADDLHEVEGSGLRPKHILSRPLRTMPRKGIPPSTSLVKSEFLPEGRSIYCQLKLWNHVREGMGVTEDDLRYVLDYSSSFGGIGQWRNAGYGRFDYELNEVVAKEVAA